MLIRTVAILIATLLCGCGSSADNRPGDLQSQRVLVFGGHGTGYVHDNIAASMRMVQELGQQAHFAVDTTSDTAYFCTDSLSHYNIVLFANASYPDTLIDKEGRRALQQFIRHGGGFVGLHAAICTGKEWRWYTRMIGGRFNMHPHKQTLTLKRTDTDHPSMLPLDDTMEFNDVLYCYTRLNPKARILAVWLTRGVEWDASRPEGVGATQPAVWCNEFEGGRSWYSAIGHDSTVYADPRYRAHVLGGLAWVVGRPRR